MDNYSNKFTTNARVRLPIYDEIDKKYNVQVDSSDTEQTEIQRPHPEAEVDGRPAIEVETSETYWYDPQGMGITNKELEYDPDGEPTLATPDVRYDRVLYWRFNVGEKLFEYKETITYLKNVEGSTTDNPWVPTSNIVDEVYGVITETMPDGKEIEFLVDSHGNVLFNEDYILDIESE
jgi:hypothetical protein